MVTILNETGPVGVAGAVVRGQDLWLPVEELERSVGWRLRSEGLCRGETCVPLPPGREEEMLDGERFNVAAFWRHLSRPVLHDAAAQTWLLGEGAQERARRLESLEAPDFSLEDLDGVPHSLSEYRGHKVFLVTWASW